MMAWIMSLPKEKRAMVVKWQDHRFNALKQYNDGRMSKDTAQRIVLKCSEKIRKIVEGAKVLSDV